MILNEGIMVRMGGDNQGLLRALSQGNMATKAFAGAAVAALAGITAASVKMAAQLDKDLRLVATLGGEAAQSTGRLRGEIQSLGREFGRNFNELARANYQAVSGGFKSITKSMELTRAGTKLAIAGNADLVGSTEGVVKWLKAFGNESLTADDAAAQLWGTTRDGIVTVEQLNRFLADLPATMGQSGIKSYELVAALSTLTGVTGNAGRAVDQLRSLVIKMEQEGFTGSLLQRIERFNEKGLGELVTLLGDQTAATGAQVLASNMDVLRQNVTGAQTVTEDFNTAVETMNDGALSEWAKLQANVNSMMSDLGAKLLPLVNVGLKTMNGLLNPSNATGAASVEEWANQQLFRTPGATPDLNILGPVGGYLQRPVQSELADVRYDLPSRYSRPLFPESSIAQDPFSQFAAPPAAGPRMYERFFDAQMLSGMKGQSTDFITGIGEFGEAAEESSAMASASAAILSSAVGGLLVSAFVTAESATGRFVQGLLAQFAQLGIQKGVGALFGLTPFASGGYTGASNGLVHPGEFVFNADAVRALGVGSLERQHRVAQAGGAEITINQTINGGNPSDVAGVTKAGVMSAIREADATGQSRLYQSSAARWGR